METQANAQTEQTEQTFDQWLWEGTPTVAEEIAAFNEWLWEGAAPVAQTPTPQASTPWHVEELPPMQAPPATPWQHPQPRTLRTAPDGSLEIRPLSDLDRKCAAWCADELTRRGVALVGVMMADPKYSELLRWMRKHAPLAGSSARELEAAARHYFWMPKEQDPDNLIGQAARTIESELLEDI